MPSKSIKKNQKLGDILCEGGLIDNNELSQALEIQKQSKGFLGELLIELGYIDKRELLRILSNKYDISYIDLETIELDRSLPSIIPAEMAISKKMVPISLVDNNLELAMSDPTDFKYINDLSFKIGYSITPRFATESDVIQAIRKLYKGKVTLRQLKRKGLRLSPFVAKGYGYIKFTHDGQQQENTKLTFNRMLTFLVLNKASDLYLIPGTKPSYRLDGEVNRLDNFEVLTPEDTERYVFSLVGEESKKNLLARKDCDLSYYLNGVGRFRINIYRQRRSLALAARHISDDIPTLPELELPNTNIIEENLLKPQGLIIITGGTGQGKSTTMAAMIDFINTNRKSQIITIEDPIEFIHYHKHSNVSQREVGHDTPTFTEGLKHIFRQDPDVIVIGEMRDLDSISIALKAADTGHLVISTLHTMDVTTAITRICNVFPGDKQNLIRNQLADSLLMLISQRLIPASSEGRIPVCEFLLPNYAIKNAIRTGNPNLIRGIMETNTDIGMLSFEHAIKRLLNEKKISPETAQFYS